MPRQKRDRSSTGVYHVMLRGINHGDMAGIISWEFECERRLRELHKKVGLSIRKLSIITV